MTTILTIISAFVILPPYITQHAYLLYHLALFNFSNLILCKAKLVIRLPVHPFPLCLYAYIYFKSFPRKKKNSLAFTIVAHWIRCSHWPYIKLTCPFRCQSLNLEHKLVLIYVKYIFFLWMWPQIIILASLLRSAPCCFLAFHTWQLFLLKLTWMLVSFKSIVFPFLESLVITNFSVKFLV